MAGTGQPADFDHSPAFNCSLTSIKANPSKLLPCHSTGSAARLLGVLPGPGPRSNSTIPIDPMTNPTTPKRWRPRFSLRTLVTLVTLVCCYAACWGPTKKWGVADLHGLQERFWLEPFVNTPSAIAPLILRNDEWRRAGKGGGLNPIRCYYFWFFGYVVKLPYERDLTLQQQIDRSAASNAKLREKIRASEEAISRIRVP